jgi:[methyl-Co(III) methanol-specific corrinoid protein]:coenzyme M methyltransferase
MREGKPDLSPRRRFLSGLFRGGKGRRISVASPTSIACQELMKKCGVYFPEAHLDYRQMAELAAGGYEVLGFDTVMPAFSVHQLSAALGCEMDWGDSTMMPDAKTHPVKEVGDIHIPENILEKPSVRVILDAISLLRHEYGDRVAIMGKVQGPWTLCYHLVGVNDFMVMTLTECEKVRIFLDILKEAVISFANAQLQAGADCVCLPDHATGDLVSPQMYADYLVLVHRNMLSRIGGPTILHVCGNCADRLDIFAEEGYDGYHYEWQVDTKEAVRIVNGRMALVGNISNIKALLQGTPDDVYQQARYSIENGVDVLAPECAVPLQTPIENLKAIVTAAEAGY